jgi:hypothetical protein
VSPQQSSSLQQPPKRQECFPLNRLQLNRPQPLDLHPVSQQLSALQHSAGAAQSATQHSTGAAQSATQHSAGAQQSAGTQH